MFRCWTHLLWDLLVLCKVGRRFAELTCHLCYCRLFWKVRLKIKDSFSFIAFSLKNCRLHALLRYDLRMPIESPLIESLSSI